ncbi:MAG: hypothetical protein MJK04_02035 [Psychrosphaera sp.]|nr:hypothetical protein [Psychrosphaera sp.]
MTSEKWQTLLQTIVLSAGFILTSTRVNAENLTHTQKQSEKAPAQTSQLAGLIGNWKIDDYFLNKEGKWVFAGGAQWKFYWILGGTAIQDDWIAPAPDKPAPKAGRQYGTNIRIFNPKLKRWEMAWASNTGGKIDTFNAVAQGESVVMSGFFNGADSRITFYDIKKDRFSWKLEQQIKDSGKFKEIYRIKGSRIKG